jgi:CRISPR-associated protein Cas5d
MNSPPLEIKVKGDFACFTRPEFGAERVTYEVMTPSAARGILEAVFWKPEFRWRVLEIHVLNPIRHTSILRNEINQVQVARPGASEDERYYADSAKTPKEGGDGKNRSQRHMLALRDVAYVIKATLDLKPHAIASGVVPMKYIAQFNRRVERGQCHHQPYFGTREFTAFFEKPDGTEEAQPISDQFGLMLFDLEFGQVKGGKLSYVSKDESGSRIVKGQAKPKFFSAELENGVLHIPQNLYGGVT